MSPTTTAISVLLGIAFLHAGIPKILRTAHYRERSRRWRLPTRLLAVIGLVESGGATLLLVGAATQRDRPAVAGAALLVATMAGAVVTHLRIADPPVKALAPASLGVLATLEVALLSL